LARGMRAAEQDVIEISDAHELPGNKLARFAVERWAVASIALTIARGGQGDLVDNVVEARPDLVLIVKSPYLTRNTVAQIRNQTRALVVNWLPDDPFLALRPAMKLATLTAYDLVVTYSDTICWRLTSELGLSAMVIPFGFDPSDYRPATARSVEWDVTFVGQWSKYRERILWEIARTGLALRVYGPNWHHAQSKVRDCWNSTEAYGADACTRYQ